MQSSQILEAPMFWLSRILPLAFIASLAAAPSNAFVGYGVESGEQMYDSLQHGYRPDLDGPRYHYAPPPRRGLRRYR
jgi:hypothetical protein